MIHIYFFLKIFRNLFCYLYVLKCGYKSWITRYGDVPSVKTVEMVYLKMAKEKRECDVHLHGLVVAFILVPLYCVCCRVRRKTLVIMIIVMTVMVINVWCWVAVRIWCHLMYNYSEIIRYACTKWNFWMMNIHVTFQAEASVLGEWAAAWHTSSFVLGASTRWRCSPLLAGESGNTWCRAGVRRTTRAGSDQPSLQARRAPENYTLRVCIQKYMYYKYMYMYYIFIYLIIRSTAMLYEFGWSTNPNTIS